MFLLNHIPFPSVRDNHGPHCHGDFFACIYSFTTFWCTLKDVLSFCLFSNFVYKSHPGSTELYFVHSIKYIIFHYMLVPQYFIQPTNCGHLKYFQFGAPRTILIKSTICYMDLGAYEFSRVIIPEWNWEVIRYKWHLVSRYYKMFSYMVLLMYTFSGSLQRFSLFLICTKSSKWLV